MSSSDPAASVWSMAKRRAATVLVAAGLLVLVILSWCVWWMGESLVPVVEGVAGGDLVDAVGAADLSPAPLCREEASDGRFALFVITESGSGRPCAGAVVLADGHLFPRPGDRLGISDAHGVARVEVVQGRETGPMVVTKPGFVPQRVASAGLGQVRRVALDRGLSLEVVFVDGAGSPVPDVECSLTSFDVPNRNLLQGAEAPGLLRGQPSFALGRSGANGVARLEGLVAGLYVLEARHPIWMALPLSEITAPVRVPRDPLRVTLVEPMVAAWAYESDEIVDLWKSGKGHVVQQVPHGIAERLVEHPGSQVYVTVGGDGGGQGDPGVDVLALFRHAGYLRHRVVMRRASELREPDRVAVPSSAGRGLCRQIVFQCDELPVPQASVELLLQAQGDVVRGLISGTRLADRGLFVSARLGVPVHVPVGRYRVLDREGWIAPTVLDVDDADRELQVPLRRSADVAAVTVSMATSDGVVAAGTCVFRSGGAGLPAQMRVFRMHPAADRTLAVGVGDYEVKISSLGYEDVFLRRTLAEPQLGQRIDLHVVLQARR